ncbi:hypothetical protein CVT25_000504 [Psilocybe cyanescens]|uniref:Uncharacterized protein n=1 Tax=Psilocybe cyanescens TaxID=93625 RepID=A0A409XLZ0_PSICY|nr:hypothetical protein CVT25_000504 [Psilocybe cyanescens]
MTSQHISVLTRHHITNDGEFQSWFKTTHFIVDSYHYTNHKTTDVVCRYWCNPAGTNGSAPNLVLPAVDKKGNPCWKRTFNTQACEQLNSWLGGYESILKWMTPGNFDWFLHTMLFYHSKYIIEKQKAQKERKEKAEKDVSNSKDENSDNDTM